ncbi:hypothetical protein [Thaumasiovibrio subtropicus]|uniref:hypothetical protein n=1 Tax=Thaumasiovibrio subtropicus TaxID=1891207 RepID=UPI000B34DC6B|nr:hypothetical protein [Thaumasiovibrio subtropicus]
MDAKLAQNKQQIIGALYAKGWTVSSWARAHQFNPRTVLHCIDNFAPNTNNTPKRKLSKAIMAKLQQTLSTDE